MADDKRIGHYNYRVGIDPGVETGLAIISKFKNGGPLDIADVQTLPIHRAMDRVLQMEMNNPGEVYVRFEDARLRKWIPRQKNEKAERGRAQGAGSVKRDCQIWEDFLTYWKIPFDKVAPKNNSTKLDDIKFKMITGYKGRTNEHGRDALMLIYGF